MKFNSQICTTKEQSERLLALGLKKETADMMYCKTAYGESITEKDDDYLEHFDVPAWSLHRLFELYTKGFRSSSWNMAHFDWDNLIDCIEMQINEGYFNPKFLEEV